MPELLQHERRDHERAFKESRLTDVIQAAVDNDARVQYFLRNAVIPAARTFQNVCATRNAEPTAKIPEPNVEQDRNCLRKHRNADGMHGKAHQVCQQQSEHQPQHTEQDIHRRRSVQPALRRTKKTPDAVDDMRGV